MCRWTLVAKEICFPNSFVGYFFRLGQCALYFFFIIMCILFIITVYHTFANWAHPLRALPGGPSRRPLHRLGINPSPRQRVPLHRWGAIQALNSTCPLSCPCTHGWGCHLGSPVYDLWASVLKPWGGGKLPCTAWASALKPWGDGKLRCTGAVETPSMCPELSGGLGLSYLLASVGSSVAVA